MANNDERDELELSVGELYSERYRIRSQIGKGGMGRVYLAEDLRLGGKQRALKLMRPLKDERRTFLPEAQILSELDHPHLPAIVDYYPPNEAGVACMVMDYIAGDTLAQRFERYRYRLPFAFVLRVMIHLCEVLIYLHRQKPPIVFRDLKPANVLLDHQDNAILVDFGIARWYRSEQQSDTLQLGTPGFAAPEQLRGEQSDHRTDLYGLGALTYHLLTGGQFAIRHRGPLKAVLQGDVPHEFCLLLEQLLANAIGDRIQTANDLSLQLMNIQHGLQGLPRDASPFKSRDFPQELPLINDGIKIIAIASAYPGAGATFVTLATSSCLSRSGIFHAVVECPGGSPELYAWLDGARRMPKEAIFSEVSGQQATAPAWHQGKAALYPSHPDSYASHIPDPAYASWLRRIGAPIVLLDVSSLWEDNLVKEWLISSVDQIWMVGNSYPTKWTTRRQAACTELFQLSRNRGVIWEWIANRDQPFRDRKQWLSLFPSAPIALVPELSSQAMINGMWSGEGIPKDNQTSKQLDAAFQKVLRMVIS